MVGTRAVGGLGRHVGQSMRGPAVLSAIQPEAGRFLCRSGRILFAEKALSRAVRKPRGGTFLRRHARGPGRAPMKTTTSCGAACNGRLGRHISYGLLAQWVRRHRAGRSPERTAAAFVSLLRMGRGAGRGPDSLFRAGLENGRSGAEDGGGGGGEIRLLT